MKKTKTPDELTPDQAKLDEVTPNQVAVAGKLEMQQ